MSVLLTILGVVALVLFVVLLSLGLFVFIGVLLLVGAVAVILSLIFGGPSFDFSSSSTSSGAGSADKDVLAIVQNFNDCLLNKDENECRKKYTHWTEAQQGLLTALAKQTKNDLGKRTKEFEVLDYDSFTANGQKTVKMEIETDYEKKKKVHETYELTNFSESSKKGDLKIKDLKWTYENHH